MRLDALVFRTANSIWDKAILNRHDIEIYRAREADLYPHATAAGRYCFVRYEVGDKRYWNDLDDLTAQAILFHLFENNSEQETPEIPS